MFNRLTPGNNLELVKWCAVILMALDHINKYLFNWTIPGLFEAGRLAMPLFAFVLASHLANPDFTKPNYIRLWRKLALFGVISTPFFVALGGVHGVLPLNILFTLLVASIVIFFIRSDRLWYAGLVFASTGLFVEFIWFGVATTVAAWLFLRSPDKAWTLIALLTTVAGLSVVNGNFYAVASLPAFYLLSKLPLQIPRLRYFFYMFYPSHLALLLLVRIPMESAGYLFLI